MIGSHLLRFSDRPLLIADGESQRVNTQQDNLPFEWSFLEATRDKVLRTHQYYLSWPAAEYCRRMSAGAAQVTRFNRGMIEGGDDPEFVLDAWESYALGEDELYIIGHNFLGFDFRLWRLWRRALGRPPLPHDVQLRIIDTNVLARAFKMGWKPDRSSPMAFLAWQYKVMNTPVKGVKTSLGVMAKELGITVDESKTHGAAYDIMLNHLVYWALVNKMEV